jgi:hypothetical protein
MSLQSLSLPRLGGNLAVILFVLTLIAFVVESQLTQVRALFRSIDFCISPHLYSMFKVLFAFDNQFYFCASLINKPIPLSPIFARSYIVHSSLVFAFPVHLLFLVLTTSASLESLLTGLSLALKIQFAPGDQNHLVTLRSPFPYSRFLRLTAFLTFGATLPALLWFISVSLSP